LEEDAMRNWQDGAHVIVHTKVPTRPNMKGGIPVVLMCKRTQDAPEYGGHWALFGGALEARDGGDALKAARREVNEELDGAERDTTVLELLCTVETLRDIQTVTITYYTCELTATLDQLRLKKNPKSRKVEGHGFSLFTQEDIHHLRIRPEDREALHHFFRRHGARVVEL